LGDTGRGWDAPLDDEDAPCACEDSRALAALVERIPRATELYLAAHVPEPGRVLAATFPPLLKTLQVRSFEPLDLCALARNESLGSLETLILHRDRRWACIWSCYYDQLRTLVNSPALDRVVGLRIDVPALDDACCEVLVASRLLKHLRRLWL